MKFSIEKMHAIGFGLLMYSGRKRLVVGVLVLNRYFCVDVWFS